MEGPIHADMCSASCAAKRCRQPVWITRARSTSGLRAASTYPQSGSPKPVQTLRPCDPQTFVATREFTRLAACKTLRVSVLPRRPAPSFLPAPRSRASVAFCGGCWHRVLDSRGRPVDGATIDVWSDNADGLYDVQQPDSQPKWNNRGRFVTGPDGAYSFIGIKPVSYPIPDDGPVGRMLASLGRHPYRPAHMHFIAIAAGRGCRSDERAAGDRPGQH
jgi:hypothetical protein